MSTILNSLPATIQKEVTELLKWFPIAHINYANGKFTVSPNIAISDKYAADQKYIGNVKNTDIYTNEKINFFIAQM